MTTSDLIGLAIPAMFFLAAFIGIGLRTDDHEKRIEKLEEKLRTK